MHNLNRSNSYERIDVPFFLRTWPDQPVKMTISDATLPHLAEGVRHLHESGILFHCNFAHGINWLKGGAVTTLAAQIEKLIVYYLAHPEVTPCDFMMMKLDVIGARCRRAEARGELSGRDDLTKWCGIGTDMVAIDVDGREYPCQTLLPNTMGRLADQYRCFNFADRSSLQDDRCKGCVLLPLCPTCYGSNILANGHPSLRDRGICTLSKIRALAASSLQAQMLVRREEFPAFRELEPLALLDTIRGIESVQSGVCVTDLVFAAPACA
jgi:radical SAM protein with 4Fe4S-binding SPASM domain